MNFVFISPNFPSNYAMFIEGLNQNGVTVLGVGDCPYDNLSDSLKSNLTEYYKVDTLEDYDQVYRAVAFFGFKYGRLDWIESNNEYWMEQDAKLRDDFNIKTGIHYKDVLNLRYKSKMKKFYEKAGVPTARYHLVDNYENCLAFIKEVGYPVIIKPDNGVGAEGTYKIKSVKDLKDYFKLEINAPMIMEEFINGELVSFEGVANSKKEILYATSHIYPIPVMDILHEQLDCFFYSYVNPLPQVEDAGRKVVKAFQTNSRFFHLEFFILKEDKKGLGKKGDVLGLEVNMRPPGGGCPELMNLSADICVHKVWADMVTYDSTSLKPRNPRYSGVYYARRDRDYVHSEKEILDKYEKNIRVFKDVDPGLRVVMGNKMILACFDSEEQSREFIEYCGLTKEKK